MILLCNFMHSIIIAQNLESIRINKKKLNHKQKNTRSEKNTTYFFNHLISPPIWATFSLNGFLFDFVSLVDFIDCTQEELFLCFIKKIYHLPNIYTQSRISLN